MQQYIDMLGYVWQDKVTTFSGVAESVSFDLYGCIQVALRPAMTKHEGKTDLPEGRWFDASRLVKTGKRIMEIPSFEKFAPQPQKQAPGPADKSSIK